MPTSYFNQSRPLPSLNAAKAALAVLHDYERLVQCQPLVGPVQRLNGAPGLEDTSHEIPQDEKLPHYTWYQQTEHVSILPFGLYKKKVVFHNWFKHLISGNSSRMSSAEVDLNEAGGGGVESICYAPSNIKIYAVFRIEKAREDGEMNGYVNGHNDVDKGWRIVEQTEMTCSNWLILQFSERQHRAAHEKMLDAIVQEAMKEISIGQTNGSVSTSETGRTKQAGVVELQGSMIPPATMER